MEDPRVEEARLASEEAIQKVIKMPMLADLTDEELSKRMEGEQDSNTRSDLIREWRNRYGASAASREYAAARERARLRQEAVASAPPHPAPEPQSASEQTGAHQPPPGPVHDPLQDKGIISPLEALSLGFMSLCQQYEAMGSQLEWMASALTQLRRDAGLDKQVVIATEMPPVPKGKR